MSDADTQTLTSLDPRTGRELQTLPTTTVAAIQHAAASARAVFDATVIPPDPAVLLSALAAAITDAGEELVTLADAETALGRPRLTGELARTAFQLRAFAQLAGSAVLLDPVIDTADPDRVPPRAEQRSVQVPLGPVGVFAASNFPFAFGVLGGDTASALAAGCPVVVEAHPAQPATSAALARIVAGALSAADVPAAWLQVVQGAGAEAGIALVSHPGIAAVGFTGSFAGGRALVKAGADRPIPIPVYAEMGSLNPVFLSPGAAATKAAELATAWVGTLVANAGQLCTKPGLLVLPGEEFLAEVESAVRAALSAAEVPPMLAPRLQAGLKHRLSEIGAVDGVRLVGSPERSEPAGPAGESEPEGTWQRAVVAFVDVATVLAEPTLLEEAFGPVGVVAVATDPHQALELAAAIPGSLTAGLHLAAADATTDEDDEWATHALRILRPKAGRLLVGGWPTGVSVGWATVHGGPWPATSAPATTSVGLGAARRFTRPVAYQGVPDRLRPEALRDANPLGLVRRVDGQPTLATIAVA